MLHPTAYIEFRQWHYKTLGRYPSSRQLAWFWAKSIGGKPAIAPVTLSQLRHPVYLRPWSSDLYVFEQVFVAREYDTPLNSPATIVDAGANIGLASVYFANRFPEARIIALEPEQDNFSMLQVNTAQYPNVHCVQAGLWHRRAKLKLINAADKSWAFRFAEAGADDSEATTPSLGVDDLIDDFFEGNPIDLVKIDIEGAEKEVFAAGGRWLAGARTIIVECHDRLVPQCEETVVQSVKTCGFSLRRSGEYLVFERQASGPVNND